MLIDNTARKVPIAKIYVDTPYLKGHVEAQCLSDPIYDLIIGNVRDARDAQNPDPSWQEACAVTIRSQAKKKDERTTLKVPSTRENPVVDREKLKQMQREDESLRKYWDRDSALVKGQAEISFEEKSGVLYRLYQHPYVNGGKPLKQVMVPEKLRHPIMEVAHGSIMSGHMGIKKTTDKIQSSFYWPGIQGDATRFCKSCDVCQKIVSKGSVPKVPLEKMPLIDKPFKGVAIDLVGPISPPSEEGHRYILTLVDFSTHYPEAVPLKNIHTETVAEALVDTFSHLGVPEEILSDLGTQFLSDCMREVTRLLRIKQLTTTPYHPMCNGLTEKFNRTMKSMLKRLCSEQPRQWHRYINPLLFTYREVPQESTGFSPFELLYGRAVRGPFQSGEKVLILLPTDHNKLLMQWKGPFEVSSVVGLNDYKVKVKGKEKVYHANLLKKYFEREESTAEGAVAGGVGATCIANAVDCAAKADEAEGQNVDFLELDGYVAKESIEDVETGPNLTDKQRNEFLDLAKQFTNKN